MFIKAYKITNKFQKYSFLDRGSDENNLIHKNRFIANFRSKYKHIQNIIRLKIILISNFKRSQGGI